MWIVRFGVKIHPKINSKIQPIQRVNVLLLTAFATTIRFALDRQAESKWNSTHRFIQFEYFSQKRKQTDFFFRSQIILFLPFAFCLFVLFVFCIKLSHTYLCIHENKSSIRSTSIAFTAFTESTIFTNGKYFKFATRFFF